MKNHWLVDILLYILGACFNGALLIIVVYSVLVFAMRGFQMGEGFAAQMTTEKKNEEVTLVLEEETNRAEAARMLEELGVIENRYLFELELFLKNSSRSYRAGTYTLNTNMSNTTVNATLRKLPVETVEHDRITIPEGFSVRDIALYLEGRDFFTAEEFIEACNNYEVPFFFFRDVPNLPERVNKLEGYLFPDTYYIPGNPTPEDIIYRMLARFDEVYTFDYRLRAEELGKTLDEIVIMASMIEKEVRVAEERPKVAGVMYNRLRIPMRLNIDATVIFALDKTRDRLSFADYEIDSPYSTYTRDGLPVGPISNPGASCIHAALYPEEHNYLYYVVSNPETGEHHFTRTLEEHNQASALYFQMLDN